MTTGKYQCPICDKWRSYKGKCGQSILKVRTDKKTDISKLEIYEHVCLSCFYKIKKIVNLTEVM